MRFGRDVTRTWRLSTTIRNLTSCIRKSAQTEKLHRRTENGIKQIRTRADVAGAVSAENAADARWFAGNKLRANGILKAGKRIAYGLVQSAWRDFCLELA